MENYKINNKGPIILKEPLGNNYKVNPKPKSSYGEIHNGIRGGSYGEICPSGLEYLTTLDTIIIKQEVEFIESILGCERNNRYNIKSKGNENMFEMKETSDNCNRFCCGSIRPFELNIKDLNQKTIIQLTRALNCDACCFPCCLQEMKVFSPPGVLAGSIKQTWSVFPRFDVLDSRGETVFKIEGPLCTCSCFCKNVEFKVFSACGKVQLSKINKKRSGCLRETFTDADSFVVNFPIDLNIQMKTVLIGATFLIDFMYFERMG